MLKDLQEQLAEVLRQKALVEAEIQFRAHKGRTGTHHDDELRRLTAIEKRLRAQIKELKAINRKEKIDNGE